MKIYLASSFLNKYNAREAMNFLEDHNHRITYDWTAHEETTSTAVLQRESVEDLQGVKDADAFILLLPGRRGSASELGAALALGKPCIIVGGVNLFDSVYYNHPLVRVAGTLTDALRILEAI